MSDPPQKGLDEIQAQINGVVRDIKTLLMAEAYRNCAIVLLRHGESEGNAAKIVQGHTDSLLTTKGRKEAEAAGLLLEEWTRQAGVRFDRIISSDLERAWRTAEIVQRFLGRDRRRLRDNIHNFRNSPRDIFSFAKKIWNMGRPSLETDRAMRERYYGVLQGLPRQVYGDGADELFLKDEDGNFVRDRDERRVGVGAELEAEVALRAVQAFYKHLLAHPGENILFVAHRSFFDGLLAGLMGKGLKPENAVPYRLNFSLRDQAFQAEKLALS